MLLSGFGGLLESFNYLLSAAGSVLSSLFSASSNIRDTTAVSGPSSESVCAGGGLVTGLLGYAHSPIRGCCDSCSSIIYLLCIR